MIITNITEKIKKPLSLFSSLSNLMPKSRLSFRVLSYILICSTLFTFISSAIQLYSEYQRDMGGVKEGLNQISKSYLNFISLSLWDLNERQLNMQLEGALLLPDIQYLEVTEIRDKKEEIFSHAGTPKKQSVTLYQFPLFHKAVQDKMHIGNLYVTINLEGVYQRLYERAVLILTTQAIKTFLWAFCVLTIFQYVIMQNLDTIAGYLKQLDVTRLNIPLTLKRRSSASARQDELEQVVMAINAMSKNLMQSISKQQQAEEELRQSERYKEIQNQIANVFLTIPDEKMYGEVLEIVIREMKSQFGIFGFIEINGDLVIPSLTREIVNGCRVYGKSIVFPQNEWGTSLWGRSIREQKALFSDGPFHTPEGHVNIESFLTVPIVFGNETIGIFSVANKKNNYTEEDQKLLESIAGYVSPILNARLQRDRKELDRKAAEKALLRLNMELDQRVLDRTAQLEAANRELEAFAYSVSHDLRAPLRHIDGFMELLKKNIITALDEKGHQYMGIISASAHKMGQLIDDLLSFSRMGRKEMKLQEVDLGIIAHEVIRDLESETRERYIQWDVDDFPPVRGDASMLQIVMTNLISNAVKFTQSREQGIIRAGCESREGETVVFIRDNGVGFDQNYADKIFDVFQRLHKADEFEGTGVGLAMVQRIIHRHGGRVWAEGEVDKGAIFYFSLPQSVTKEKGREL